MWKILIFFNLLLEMNVFSVSIWVHLVLSKKNQYWDIMLLRVRIFLQSLLLKKKQKYKEFKPFLQNKVHRLLIPFLVLGALTNLTQVNRNFLPEMFYGKPSHLWYCLMLFYCYIVCWLIEKRGQKYNIVAMCVSVAVVIAKG